MSENLNRDVRLVSEIFKKAPHVLEYFQLDSMLAYGSASIVASEDKTMADMTILSRCLGGDLEKQIRKAPLSISCSVYRDIYNIRPETAALLLVRAPLQKSVSIGGQSEQTKPLSEILSAELKRVAKYLESNLTRTMTKANVETRLLANAEISPESPFWGLSELASKIMEKKEVYVSEGLDAWGDW